MKLRFAFLGLLSLIAVSCSYEESFVPEDKDDNSAAEFYVVIDEQPVADTKVYADENMKVLWNADDLMSIFNRNTFNQEYIFLGADGANAGAIVRVDDTAGSGDPLEHIYAVYPYVESTSIGASGTLSFTLPSEQSYHEKSFGIGANTMVSVTDDIRLRFKNVGGYLSLKFYGEGVSVSSIVLKGNNGELLSGPCSIVTSGGIPAVTMSSGASDQVTLVCDPPVELGATSSDAVQFIFVLPPVTLAEGFTVTVTAPGGAVFEKSSSNKFEIGRSAITKLGAMKVLPELPGNIVFADQTVKSICVKYWDENNDGGLSYGEAAAVTSLMVDAALTKAGEEVSAFAGTGITTFDELVYFTGLLEIEEGAFENCKDLKSVTISEHVGKIGDNAFNGCQNLESITLTSPIPPEIGANVFDNTNDCPIYVPEEAIEAYQSEWSEHLDYVERILGAILPENFPDENFRAYVFKNFDTDKDGILSEAECNAVTTIRVETDNISSLKGIEYFINLQNLSCSLKDFSTLRKYFNPETHEWHLYDANDNEVIGLLSSLDISNNTSLKYLYCQGNQLTSIDISNNTALSVLNCSWNQIGSLDVSNNSALTSLDFSYNNITSVDVSNNSSLTSLSCDDNLLTSLDVSNNTALIRLSCAYNPLKVIDVKNNTALTTLVCRSNQLEEIDVSNNTSLISLYCDYNQLTSLDVSNNTSLTSLYCDENLLISLDVSKNPSLATLYCSNSTMQYLFLAEGQKIARLYKNNNTEIVYKGAEPVERFIACTGLDKVPFICNDFNLSSEISGTVLETLDMEYEMFKDLYGFKGIWGYKGVLSDDGQSVESRFVKLVESGNADEDIRLSFSEWYMKNGAPAQREKDLGTARYSGSNSGLGPASFLWQVSPQGLGAGTSSDIYFCFESITGDIAYFIMTADVAWPASFDFGANKLSNEWYTDVDGEYLNTARINARVPSQTSDDVTDFWRDLNQLFVAYKPSLNLSANSDPVYQNYFDNDQSNDDIYNPEELKASVEYVFSTDQPVINGMTLCTTFWADSDVLYVGSSNDLMTVQFNGKTISVPRCDLSNIVATLNPDGTLIYYYPEGETVAKSLLNLWSYTETDQSKMFYANIIGKISYGENHIKSSGGDAWFHVRFIRPLDVNLKAVDAVEESAVDGVNVQISDFISGITDWNKQSIIVRNQNTGNYMANIIHGINMYHYYGISRLVLDLDNAERDNFMISDGNARGLIKDITPYASLCLGFVNPDSGVFVPGGSNELDIADIANIADVVINYRNSQGIVEAFNIYIPMSIEYAWGSLEGTFVVRVRPENN